MDYKTNETIKMLIEVLKEADRTNDRKAWKTGVQMLGKIQAEPHIKKSLDIIWHSSMCANEDIIILALEFLIS